MNDLVKLAGVFVAASSSPFRVNTVKMLEENISFIEHDLRYQYTLGFKVVASEDKWHRVNVKVNLPPDSSPDSSKEQKHIFVRSREKYYAVTNSQ